MPKAYEPPNDLFDLRFTNREKELAHWSSILSRGLGHEGPAVLWYSGVPGSGKTFLKKRFQQSCQNRAIPYLSLELDPTRGGVDISDAVVVITALASRIPTPLPRTALALARIADLESGPSAHGNQFEEDLLQEVAGSALDSLQKLESFSLGGVLSLALKEGIKSLSASSKAARRLQETDEGKKLSQWLEKTHDTPTLRSELWKILRADLENSDPQDGQAIRAVIFIDSLEHGRTGTLSMLRVACESLDSTQCAGQPTVLFVCFSQQHSQLKVNEGLIEEVQLHGVSKDCAIEYCLQKRNIPQEFIDKVLDESKETSSRRTFHPLALALACDFYGQLAPDTTVDSIADNETANNLLESLSKRVFSTLNDYQQRKLRKLARTIYFQRSAIAYAFSIQADEEKTDSVISWLKSLSFVQEIVPGTLCFHEIVRNVLIKNSTEEEQARWDAAWIDFSEEEMRAGVATGAERFLYHIFLKNPESALETWLGIVNNFRINGSTHGQALMTIMAEYPMCDLLHEQQIGTPILRVKCILAWCGSATQTEVANWIGLAQRTSARLRELLAEGWLEDHPEEYLRVRIELARVLLKIGQRTINIDIMRESVDTLRAVLSNPTLPSFPRLEALACNNIVKAHATLFEFGDPILNADEQFGTLARAEMVFVSSGESSLLAETKACLGHLCYCMWTNTSDIAWLVRGKYAYQEGLYLYENLPRSGTMYSILYNMGVTLTDLGVYSGNINYLIQAEAMYRGLLQRSSSLSSTQEAKEILANLGALTLKLSDFTHSRCYCLMSIDYSKRALQSIENDLNSDSAFYRTRARLGLGAAYLSLSNYRDKAGCLREIIRYVEPLLVDNSLEKFLPIRIRALILVAQAEGIPGVQGPQPVDQKVSHGLVQARQLDKSIDMLSLAQKLCLEIRDAQLRAHCNNLLNEMLNLRTVLNKDLWQGIR